MEIEVFIIARNKEKSIQDCIAGIRNHLPNAAITLIDNLSDDQTCRMASELDCKTIINPVIGVSASRNLAISVSSRKFMMLLDGDLLLTNFDEASIQSQFANQPKLAGVCGNYEYEEYQPWDLDTLMTLRRKHLLLKNHRSFTFSLKKRLTTFSGGFCVLKNPARLPLFPSISSSSGEDFLWQIAVLKNGSELAYCTELKAVHRHNRTRWNEIRTKLKEEARAVVHIHKNDRVPYMLCINYYPIYIPIALLGIFWDPLISIAVNALAFLPSLYAIYRERRGFSILFFQFLKDLYLLIETPRFSSLNFLLLSHLMGLLKWSKDKHDLSLPEKDNRIS